jgi:hypothetical protein
VLLVGAVDYGAVLYIYAVAHFYKVYITSYYGIKPKTAFFSSGYIANDGSVGCNKAVFSKTG